jgi:DNA-binding MarR family transcriptional regulator
MNRLGRRLVDLSREVTTTSGRTTLKSADTAVLEDLLAHPDSAVNEVAARTGFAQSHVSVTIARLRDVGYVTTVVDPFDRRRSRVRLAAATRRAILRRASHPADAVVTAALVDESRSRRAIELLEELADLMLDGESAVGAPAG